MRNFVFFIKRIIKEVFFLIPKNDGFQEFHHFPFNHNVPLPNVAPFVMAQCCELLESIKVNYRITDGTILGLYRQGTFIPHDNDIDVDALDFHSIDLLHEGMKRHGMRLGRKVIYKKQLQQLVYYNEDQVVFDIVFWHSEGNKIYNYSERGYERIQEKQFFENLTYIEYKGRNYPMPSNIEKWLDMRFGQDWRIPKTYKRDWKEECGDIKKIN